MPPLPKLNSFTWEELIENDITSDEKAGDFESWVDPLKPIDGSGVYQRDETINARWNETEYRRIQSDDDDTFSEYWNRKMRQQRNKK